MKSLMNVIKISLTALALAWSPALFAGENKVVEMLAAGDQQVESLGRTRVSFNLTAIPAKPLALECEAWVKAKRFQGYRGAFKVFLDGVELTEAESHPMSSFQMRDGRKIPTFSPKSGWYVAQIGDPVELRSQTDSVYFPTEQGFDPARFSFVLKGLSPGKHEIEFESSIPTETPVLFLRDISLVLKD